jgi:GNAT superfamily N-acetyltransferase
LASFGALAVQFAEDAVMTEVSVRRAVIGDESALGELAAMVHALHVAERPDVFRPLTAERLAQDWFRPVLQGDAAARVWLAEAAGAAVGYVLVKHHQRHERLFLVPLSWCEIDQIAVVASWRRRGVARLLIEAAVADAHAGGFERVETVCWWFNAPARALFEGLGFIPKFQRWELARKPGTSSAEPAAGDTAAHE